VSFRFPGVIKQAFAEVWAPYKKIFVHPIMRADGDWETWGCDGSAIIQENWDAKRVADCQSRIMRAMGSDIVPTAVNEGLRPFHSGGAKPCYLELVDDRIWCTTGAGKFGSIAAGWAANELLHAA